MKIQVFGSGCATCKSLYELTMKAVSELGLEEEVEYITDVQKMLELGVMSSPVLVVDGKTVLVGSVPNLDKVKSLIGGDTNKEDKSSNCGCSCGGKC